MPSTSDLNPGKPAVQFALGERQIAALGFVAFLILGSLTAVAYVAGRSVTAPSPAPVAATPVPRPASPASTPPVEIAKAAAPKASSAVEKLIIVETATAAPVPPPPPPAAAAPVPAVAPPPVLKQPAGPATVVTSDKLVKQSFWQVAALDRKMADDAYAGLMQQNLPVLIAEGPTPDVFRVLVGPLSGPDHTSKMKAALEAGGFQPFFKRY